MRFKGDLKIGNYINLHRDMPDEDWENLSTVDSSTGERVFNHNLNVYEQGNDVVVEATPIVDRSNATSPEEAPPSTLLNRVTLATLTDEVDQTGQLKVIHLGDNVYSTLDGENRVRIYSNLTTGQPEVQASFLLDSSDGEVAKLRNDATHLYIGQGNTLKAFPLSGGSSTSSTQVDTPVFSFDAGFPIDDIAIDTENSKVYLGGTKLAVLDISDIDNPQHAIDPINFQQEVTGLWVQKGHMLLATTQHIISYKPTEDSFEQVDYIHVSNNDLLPIRDGDHIVATEHYRTNIIDISDPENLVVNDFRTSGVWYGTVTGDALMLSKGSNGIDIYDIKDPSKPEFVTNVDTPDFDSELIMTEGRTMMLVDSKVGSRLIDLQALLQSTMPESFQIQPMANFSLGEGEMVDMEFDGDDVWVCQNNTLVQLDKEAFLAGRGADAVKSTLPLDLSEDVQAIAVGGGRLGVITDNQLIIKDISTEAGALTSFSKQSVGLFTIDNALLPFDFQDLKILDVDGKPHALLATDFAILNFDISDIDNPELKQLQPKMMSWPSDFFEEARPTAAGLIAINSLLLSLSPLVFSSTLAISPFFGPLAVPTIIAGLSYPAVVTAGAATTAVVLGTDYLIRDVLNIDLNSQKEHFQSKDGLIFSSGLSGILSVIDPSQEGVTEPKFSHVFKLSRGGDVTNKPVFMDDLVIFPGIDALYIGTLNYNANDGLDIENENYLQFSENGVSHETEIRNQPLENILNRLENPSNKHPQFVESAVAYKNTCFVSLGHANGNSTTVDVDRIAVLQRSENTLQPLGFLLQKADSLEVINNHLYVRSKSEGLKVFDLETNDIFDALVIDGETTDDLAPNVNLSTSLSSTIDAYKAESTSQSVEVSTEQLLARYHQALPGLVEFYVNQGEPSHIETGNKLNNLDSMLTYLIETIPDTTSRNLLSIILITSTHKSINSDLFLVDGELNSNVENLKTTDSQIVNNGLDLLRESTNNDIAETIINIIESFR